MLFRFLVNPAKFFAFNYLELMMDVLTELNSINCQKPLALLETVRSLLQTYVMEKTTESVCQMIPLIFPLAEAVSFVLLHGRQLSNNLPDLQKSEELIEKCCNSGNIALKFFSLTKQEPQEKTVADSAVEVMIHSCYT